MNELFSRYKYPLLSAFVVVVTLFLIVYFMVPKAVRAGEILSTVRAELDVSKSSNGAVRSPDSLIADYKRMSAQIDEHINVPVSSSKILKFILGAADSNKVSLQDLSTGEVVKSELYLEYPVSFKARADFSQLHKFLLTLENGIYCVKVSDIDMKQDLSSVKLSVLSKVGINE